MPTPYLLSRVSCVNEWAEVPDVIVVELTPEFVETIKALDDAASDAFEAVNLKSDQTVSGELSIYAGHLSVHLLEWPEMDEGGCEIFPDEKEYVIVDELPEDLKGVEEESHIDTHQLKVDGNGNLTISACGKYSGDEYFSSSSISIDEVCDAKLVQ